MKKALICVFFGFILVASALCLSLLARQGELADKLLRFHVVADSDSPEDQALKLRVRDELLETLRPLCAQAQDRDEMAALVKRSLPALKQEAERTLRECGSSDTVAVTLGTEPFPTRCYDTFALPAGDYLSLRVRLGNAEGHNWWCVCFPALCQSACTDGVKLAAAGAGFTQKEIDWITDSGNYEISFKVLEWLEKLRSR